MEKLLDNLWELVARDKSLTLQLRLFRLLCLTAAIVSLLIVLPVNLFQPAIPMVVNLADIAVGLLAIFCYSESCRGRHYIGAFLGMLVALLTPIWFLNGGAGGSIIYYFFPILVIPLVLYRGRSRWLISAGIVVLVGVLYAVEYHLPDSVTRLENRASLFLDNFTGVFCSFIALALVIWVILRSYDSEQEKITHYAHELARSEENYRSVVENAKSIILRLDPEGRVTFFNRFAENVFGYAREEIVGRHALGTIVPHTSSKGENLSERLNRLLRQPEKFPNAENENVCRDGRRIWVTWTNQPLYDERGQLREILCVGADVTQQAALLEQLRLTQLTMDAAAEQILWADDQARVIYANAAAMTSLGYTAEELRALTLHELATDFPSPQWADFWSRLQREHAITLELTQRSQTGTTRPVELSFTYFKITDKQYTAVFIRDLTERHQTEEKRRQHEAQMQHMQRLESLGLLAGGIAHDFNNLLTAILANVSLVKIELPPNCEAQELLSEAERASFQARSLTAQLLTFAKGGRPVRRAVQLEQIIRDSASFALRGKPAKCNLEIPPDLPPVEADAAQLAQVFNNLLLNAQQAMPEGGQITIQVRPHITGQYLETIIRDQGCGIVPENLAKIFDPYFTTKKTGSGLGLAVVYSIINNHQGTVSVESAPGRGTTFTLLLPVSRRTPTATLAPPVAPACRARRILIMDDEAMVASVLAKMLQKLGCETEIAPDGQTALEKYRAAAAAKKPFDLVIMDLTIPGGMGGKEAIRQVREFDPQVQAIVSSGYSNDPILADFAEHGFGGVLLKPYTHEQVQAALQQVFST